jgi:hypothetical protein
MASISLDGHPAQPGIPSYNSVPLLSVTQTPTSSSNGRYAITSWIPTTFPCRFSFVGINRWPVVFQLQNPPLHLRPDVVASHREWQRRASTVQDYQQRKRAGASSWRIF